MYIYHLENALGEDIVVEATLIHKENYNQQQFTKIVAEIITQFMPKEEIMYHEYHAEEIIDFLCNEFGFILYEPVSVLLDSNELIKEIELQNI